MPLAFMQEDFPVYFTKIVNFMWTTLHVCNTSSNYGWYIEIVCKADFQIDTGT